MARILHVENELDWIEITREALLDHHVDSARTYSEALALIRGSSPYDLALIDLNLVRDNDGLGREILDVLRLECPSTRRIVVTGRPPEGGLRKNIFDAYGVEEIIIKGEMTLPDLQRVVGMALTASDTITSDVKLRKSEALQRYRSWRIFTSQAMDDKVRDAQEYVHNAGRVHGQSGRRAQEVLDALLGERELFQRQCSEVETVLTDARNLADVLAGVESLDLAMARFNSYGIDGSSVSG